MTFYGIRHKASGQLMPQAKRNRGYSHWNPATGREFQQALDVPRLLRTQRQAQRCVAQWMATPNGKTVTSQGYDGDVDYSVDGTPDGRAKADLEVVRVRVLVGAACSGSGLTASAAQVRP